MSHRIKIYQDGSVYVTGGMVSIEPSVDYQPEEYDISHFTKEELEKVKKNPKDKNLLKKARKIG